MNNLNEFLDNNKENFRKEISEILTEWQSSLGFDESKHEYESIDIRLCIDPVDTGFKYIFRIGSADYDQRHSEYCAASCFTSESKTDDILEHLISQID